MSLCRTPVAVNTAKAKKFDGKKAVETANIRSIANGILECHCAEVKSAIADSHARIEKRRAQKLGEACVAFDLFKTTGNITQFLEVMAEVPPMPYAM